MKIRTAQCESPVGALHLAVFGEALCALGFAEQWPSLVARMTARFGAIDLVEERDPSGISARVVAYLDGELDALDALAVDPGGTPFQQRVWAALRALPPGAVTSYGALAATLGIATASRAVGTANGANPVSLVIPCHRVVRGDGALSGYAGGVERKRWLLRHEATHATRVAQPRASSSRSACSQS